MPKKTYIHPDTGDELTRTEMVSWRLQGIIRRWTFILMITVITAAIFTFVALHGNADSSSVLFWWNAGASYMALLIESVVGIGMISQTKRDAQILRKMDHILEKIENNELEILRVEKQELDELAELNDRLEHEQ
jgi:hypothetical protein